MPRHTIKANYRTRGKAITKGGNIIDRRRKQRQHQMMLSGIAAKSQGNELALTMREWEMLEQAVKAISMIRHGL